MAEPLLAEGLSYSVAGREVVRDVSLSLAQGELVALIGPNGAGKSTLLRLLTGFLTPAAGRCLLDGKALEKWSTQALSRQRAVMRQQTQLGFDWPVEAVIGMGRAPWTPQPEARIVSEVMQLTGCHLLAGRRYA
ncbi:MAG TPA: hemin ABC transporter ATP-binding subunit, partial [Leclercia adecarboxylata]|nr:hemin ABC transporter ATP-binding subunit [Leclercia adecarboxylata]